ncbi:uncharacterized protein RCO7_11027 [Rhynchosporium graminicola]|uniref:HAT C-terminal dimerisation domain-containing protein n=1 Tax=Rhynchosporium graminicola TaxID=2792576 RepID=A0A1E1LSZ0_9HELO|nr:uncharacterized protein RCO7_11027 [Rhynchosporium commune]
MQYRASQSLNKSRRGRFNSLRGTKRPASPIKEPFSTKKYKSLLIRFIIENNLSFRSISSTSFRELTLYLNEQSPLLYNKILHDYLNKKGYFSLTLDAWTTINQDSYLGVTIYYIDSSFKLKSHAINNIISITRDNASSNDTLINAFKKDYDIKGFKFQGDIVCLAHILNLIVQDILKNIIKDAYSELDNRGDIANIENDRERDLSNSLKHSGANNRSLKQYIEILGIKNPRFPQLVATSESKSFKKYRSILLLSEGELDYIRKCLRIFDIFVKTTTKLQAEKYPTIYYLLPSVYQIYTKLERIRDELREEPFTSAINKGIAKLQKYYPKTGITEANKALYISLVFDPRIKLDGLSLLGLSNRIISDIKRKIQAEYNSLKIQANIDLPIPERERIDIEDEDLDIYMNEEEEEFDELDYYLEERRANISATNRDKYSILSLLVRKYLQIPATSAPSERFFSQGALIINKLRNRLTRDTFETISLLKSWGFIFEENEEVEEASIIEDFFTID